MSAFDPKRTLSSGAVERDPRHNSQPNLLYPFAPLLVLQGGSADLFSLTFLQGPQVPCSAPSVILGRILRREWCELHGLACWWGRSARRQGDQYSC